MSARRFTIDLAPDDDLPPEPGDLLVRPRIVQEIVDVWPTDSRVWPNRWTLMVRTLGDRGTVQYRGRRVIESRPYRRGEGPADVWGPA